MLFSVAVMKSIALGFKRCETLVSSCSTHLCRSPVFAGGLQSCGGCLLAICQRLHCFCKLATELTVRIM
jgi:hypothetical protein